MTRNVLTIIYEIQGSISDRFNDNKLAVRALIDGNVIRYGKGQVNPFNPSTIATTHYGNTKLWKKIRD